MSKNNKRNRDNSPPVWDALAGVSAAVGQVTNIPAILIPYLEDKDLVARVQDQPRFNRLAATLNRDLRDMTAQYRAIYNQHAGRRGHTKDPTEVMRTIDMHQQYVDWASRFDDVIIPVFVDMLTMIRDAGGNTSQIQVPSAMALVDLQNN